MSCSTCIKVNPIPACLDSGSSEYILGGITFPDNADDTINVRLKDLATGRKDFFQVDVDVDSVPALDIADYFPFDDHPYSLSFYNLDGSPTRFVITNPDLTTSEGCCFDFTTHQGLTGEEVWVLTTSGCEVGA